MAFYDDKLERFRALLDARGYRVRVANAAVSDGFAAPVTIGFPTMVLGEQSLVAIPDVHISDGSAGDIFLAGNPSNVTRFTATLGAINDFLDAEGDAATVLQLGDWYDVWRAIGGDATQAQFAAIDNVAAYQALLELDKELGLAHLIGNHDASFTHALPDRRVADGDRFRFGFSLMKSSGRCYALHGHQVDDLVGVPSPPSDQQVVWLATLAAKYVTSEARNLQNFLDKEGVNAASVVHWLGALVGLNRPDPVPAPRARKGTAGPAFAGTFVDREAVDKLVRIAVDACKRLYVPPAELELLVVGHSHKPCVSWTPHPDSDRPVIVVDAGSWVQGAAQLLFGAGHRVSVFDIVPN
jgi:UDP-2,3-diacylglucosamine pyrophosphatase LpxH